MQTDEILVKLSKFKKSLKLLMNPEVLKHLASLLEAFGPGQKSFVEQFEFHHSHKFLRATNFHKKP